LNHFIICW